MLYNDKDGKYFKQNSKREENVKREVVQVDVLLYSELLTKE